MTTNPYRAMCAELVEAIEDDDFFRPTDPNNDALRFCKAVLSARTALAQPKTEGPTDEELLELMPQEMRDDLAELSRMAAQQHGSKPGIFRVVLNTNVMAYARAVLAKWGANAQ